MNAPFPLPASDPHFYAWKCKISDCAPNLLSQNYHLQVSLSKPIIHIKNSFKNKPSFLALYMDWVLKSCTGIYHSMTLGEQIHVHSMTLGEQIRVLLSIICLQGSVFKLTFSVCLAFKSNERVL